MTLPALPIHLSVKGDVVTVGLGSRPGHRIVGRVNNGQIQVAAPGRDTQMMAPYQFNLSRWTADGVPCLRTHPIAILHLLVTRQCNRGELLEALPRFIPGVPGVIMPIQHSCALLNMLGVPRANLGFATTTGDFQVGPTPS